MRFGLSLGRVLPQSQKPEVFREVVVEEVDIIPVLRVLRVVNPVAVGEESPKFFSARAIVLSTCSSAMSRCIWARDAGIARLSHQPSSAALVGFPFISRIAEERSQARAAFSIFTTWCVSRL